MEEQFNLEFKLIKYGYNTLAKIRKFANIELGVKSKEYSNENHKNKQQLCDFLEDNYIDKILSIFESKEYVEVFEKPVDNNIII